MQRRNWSGSVRLRPAEQLRPTRVDTIARAVSRARRQGRCVRAIGSAHSSNEQLCSDDVIVRMSEYAGVIEVDRPNCLATVRAGTSLAELGAALHEHDLALPNYGDIALQTLGGAIGTGTHGTGRRLQNLSQMLEAVELVDGRGEMRSVRTESGDPHAPGRNLCAARVALGCLGVMTDLTVRCVPAFDVERREYALTTDALLDGFEQFGDCNRSVDFYWYPRRDDVKLRVINAVGGGGAAPLDARLLELVSGPSHQLIPAHSGLTHRFEECEFSLPAEHGLDCFRAVRLRMIERWRASVGWRVLYRLVAADSAWLSPAQGRDSATISLHQNASLPWREFFDDLAPIFAEHGGRPHWAKKHDYSAAALRPLYPHWDDFLRVREDFDPDGVFLAPYLRNLFGVSRPALRRSEPAP